MYEVHYFPGNANAAPHMLLEELGQKYNLVLVDRAIDAQKSMNYLKINPNGRIPTLVDDNLVLFESAAIVLYLVDKHPDAGLAPKLGTPERARFYQWMIFLTNSLQEELMIWQYPDRLTGIDAAATQVVKRGAEKRASAYLDVIEQHLEANGPLFLGEILNGGERGDDVQHSGNMRPRARRHRRNLLTTNRRIDQRRLLFQREAIQMATETASRNMAERMDLPFVGLATFAGQPPCTDTGTGLTALTSPFLVSQSIPPQAIALERASGPERSAKCRCSMDSVRKAFSISRTR
jgi:glutathione S-transferase